MSLRAALKDFAYDNVPLGLLGPVLPLLPGRSPFGDKVLETGVILVHVPKAAGSSLKTELYGRPQYGHRRIVEFYAYDPERARRFFKLGFVRNPWDRLLSAHAFLTQGRDTSGRDLVFVRRVLGPRGDFESFVRALEEPRFRRAVMRYDHFRPQRYWICLPGQSGHALDFLGRYERLEEDAAKLRERLTLPPRPVGRSRSSEHPPYRDAYDARMRQVVAEIYAEDIELLGYTF